MKQTEIFSATSNTETAFSPSAILNIFTSNLNNDITRKVFKIKGVYNIGNGNSYKGIYYDVLKDEATDAFMSLLVPEVLRAGLSPNELIECNIYLTKKIQLNGGKIDLQLNLIEILSKNVASISDVQLKTFDILQRKAEIGYKDVDSFIKSKIVNSEPLSICVIIGKSGIIDSDIKHQLQEAIGFYKFNFVRINLTSDKQIIESLNHLQKQCDILAISRGGGENLEIFNNPDIAETALNLSTYFITALGHKDNAPLLQKVADKAFITPTALGQYFNDIYNNTIAELQNSKAKLVNDITTQLEGNYKKQIDSLSQNIVQLEKVNEKEISLLNRQLEDSKREQNNLTERIEKVQRYRTQRIILFKIYFNHLGIVLGYRCRIGYLLSFN